MCGPKFCSMKITQEVRDFARLQKLSSTVRPEPVGSEADPQGQRREQGADQGTAEMNKSFHDEGGKIYVPAADI